MANIVAIQRIGMVTRLRQLAFDQIGDRGLAGAGQACEPENSGFLTLDLGPGILGHIHRVVMDVGRATQAELDHTRTDRLVGEAVDQDKGTHVADLMIRIEGNRSGRRHVAEADPVHFESAARLLLIGVHVDAMLQRRYGCRRCGGTDLEQVRASRKKVFLGHPEQLRGKLIGHFRPGFRRGNDIAARNVDLVIEHKRDRFAGDGLIQITISRDNALDIGGLAGLRHHDGIARLDRAGNNRPGIATEIQIWSIDPLNRHAERFVLDLAVDIEVFQMLEQRRPRIPGHVFAALGDIVTITGGHRDRVDRLEA